MQKKLVFLACFFICCNVSAQLADPVAIGPGGLYPFVHYTPKDGLVNNRVRKAYQDSKGQMYFMTFGGLSLYDGARFTNYTVQNGLASDMVNDVMEMGNDSLWIACNSKGLNYLKRGKIKTFRTADGFCPTINRFFKSKEGELYILADEGFFIFKNDRFLRIPITDNQDRDVGKFLIDIVEWNDLLLLASDHVLNRDVATNIFIFNKTRRKIISKNENKYISAICRVSSQQVLVTDTKGSLYLVDTIALLKGEIKYLLPPNPYRDLMPGFKNIYFGPKKDCWFYAPNKKIVKIDSNGVSKEFSMANGLSSNDFTSVFEDKEGSLWITMNGSGVDKLVNDNIELFDKFSGVFIDNLYANELTDSVYLLSNSGKKIFILQREAATNRTYGTKTPFINSFGGSKGNIYLFGGNKLFLLSLNEEPVKIKEVAIARDSLATDFGNLFVDPFGNPVLYGASYITAVIGDTGFFRYPAGDYTDQVSFDKSNRLWAASREGRLFVLKVNPDQPKNYFQLLKSYDKAMPQLSARSIVADGSNNVWVGTRHDGLYCFRFDEHLIMHSFQHFTVKDGLSDNFITHLTRDRENNILASTSSGVDRITYAGGKINIENITRGNNIYKHILKTYVSKDGTAWSYTADGNLIKIASYSHSASFTPALLITGLKIGNSAVENLTDASSLSYRQNTLSISVAAPSFYDERQIKYSYLLESSGNDQWSDPSTNSTFNFINLNPGKYTLKIKASFPGNRYPDQTIDHPFLINPPWWQTWWFRIVSGLIIIGILIIGFRLYYRRKLERQKTILEKRQAIERERTRIATDMHDDLGAGLSTLRFLSEKVKRNSFSDVTRQDADKIVAGSDELVQKMNEIIWAMNEKNDSLEDLVFYTRNYAAEYCEENNLVCEIQLPESFPAVFVRGELRRNVFLVVKESLHNVVKHAQATKVVIHFSVDKMLVVSVEDDGVGFSEIKNNEGNGLINIRNRVESLGGTFELENKNRVKVLMKVPL